MFSQWQNSLVWSADVSNLFSADSVIYCTTNKKLFKSNDLTEGWKLVKEFESTIISTFVVREKLFVSTEKGLYYSISPDLNFIRIDSFQNVIYKNYQANGIIYLGTADGIFSTANFNTFEKVGLEGKRVSSFEYRYEIFYIGTEDGLYSTNNFKNYQKLTEHFEVFSIIPTETSLILATSWGILLSKDYKNFTEKKITDFPFTSSQVCFRYQNKIFSGLRDWYSGYLYFSNDEGETWNKEISFPCHSYITCIDSFQSNLVIGTNGGGIYSYINDSWKFQSRGLTGHITAITKNSKYFFAAIENGGVQRSSDAINWEPSPTPIKYPDVYDLYCIDETLYVITSYGTYKSSNNGETWDPTAFVSGELCVMTGDASGIFCAGPSGLYFSSDNLKSCKQLLRSYFLSMYKMGDTILLGSDGIVLISTDLGKNFKSLKSFNKPILSLTILGTDIFISTFGKGVYKSKDGGNTYEEINAGLDNKRVFSLKIINGKVTCSTDGWNGGIFVWNQSSNTWTKVAIPQIPNKAVTTVAEFDGKIFAGTWYEGLWSADIVEIIPTSVEHKLLIPNEIFLKQNYPNPFNPVTIINYSIPSTSYVQLKVYDTLGKEIATLVNEKQVPGNYEVTFNAGKISSGVYFYTLIFNNKIITKKMLLTK